MVGPRPSAAAEERQRKLQEYLAAKGKLKCQNTKPYLKAKNNCPNPPPSKSTIRPRKDATSHVVLPIKATRPVSSKLQPRPANIMGSQNPKLEPPTLLDKRLTSGYVSSNPNCKLSSKCQQPHESGSSVRRKLSGKPVRSLKTEELKTREQQVTDQGNVQCINSVDNAHVENDSSESCLKEINKENLPLTLPDSKRKPNSELWTINKSKNNCYNPTKSNVTTKQALGKGPVNRTILKDRANKQFVRETRTVVPPIKPQQLSRGADLLRPGGKNQTSVPSHFVQIVNRTQASKKTGLKNIKSNRNKYERPTETKLTSSAVTEQKVKNTKSRMHPSMLQGGSNSGYSNIKQDQKSTQPSFKPRTSCVLQKSKAINPRPNLTGTKINSVIPSTPAIKATEPYRNKYNSSYQQNAQTLDSKFKKSLPQNQFLNKTAPKTIAGVTATNGRRVPNGTQTNPNTEKKTAVDDRRKQLEEWRKSKGKLYKRPPMELKRKKKIIEEMNISFWKSMEKEEEEKKEQLELSNKIDSTLTECLQLIEGGVHCNEISSILSSIPEAEKFAKFWICKAKLLARKGTFDVIGLYEEAIKNGATPIQELREFVFNILQDLNRTTEGITSESLVAETNIASIEELTNQMDPENVREEVLATPQIKHNHSGIKLQIAPIPRKSGMPEVQDMKLITPVRRSVRIERVVSRYPEILQEHGLVVASLNELLDVEETDCYIFRKNEALPVTLGFQTLES
ncbi:cytoskeleton-associated protein 2-like isoform X1 [Erinaceus europaeus]|uniref:Cytoskeleton-associated protein 2-like isoform X1 n=1 Tax=Erinaceus europaeus TaxID=9365 RepID=A0ABM3X360_ERIEU|nr:cytoskeleton-associated protein 2-like isoform X1 [Erinaceus europaeus]